MRLRHTRQFCFIARKEVIDPRQRFLTLYGVELNLEVRNL